MWNMVNWFVKTGYYNPWNVVLSLWKNRECSQKGNNRLENTCTSNDATEMVKRFMALELSQKE